jgi:hypothetical protein
VPKRWIWKKFYWSYTCAPKQHVMFHIWLPQCWNSSNILVRQELKRFFLMCWRNLWNTGLPVQYYMVLKTKSCIWANVSYVKSTHRSEPPNPHTDRLCFMDIWETSHFQTKFGVKKCRFHKLNNWISPVYTVCYFMTYLNYLVKTYWTLGKLWTYVVEMGLCILNCKCYTKKTYIL